MNKKEVIIQDFGPIRDARIDLNKKFQIMIGTQASGKSTICKVVYFCQKIRDYTLDYLMDGEQFRQNHRNEYFNNWFKYLTKQFMGCFGKTTHMQRFKIEYNFGDRSIRIFLNSDGYVRFVLSPRLKEEIQLLIGQAADMFESRLSSSEASIIDSIEAMNIMKKHLNERLSSVFACDSDIIYIPAGRSLLAIMSEQLQDVSVNELDLTMQEFIRRIKDTRKAFGVKIPEMVKEYTKTVKGQISNTALGQAYSCIKKILKADYTSESEGEKMYFDDYHWVKLMYSSSGQQEALWILLLIFSAILTRKNVFMVIEEPEAHLFPVAQKEIVNLISLMVNSINGCVLVTTHSPYILTSANILLYSDKVEGVRSRSDGAVIPKALRISYNTFDAYKVGNFESSLESLMDAESHMIDTEYIDAISAVNNDELDELIDMEIKE